MVIGEMMQRGRREADAGEGAEGDMPRQRRRHSETARRYARYTVNHGARVQRVEFVLVTVNQAARSLSQSVVVL